jgi:hypothetical protein
VTAHVLPPLPALAPWWRRPVTVTLSATDGDGGPDESGVATVAYSLDGAAFQPYTGPIVVGSGPHTITTRALDVAGLISPPHTVPLLVDDTPPTALAGSPSPAIWAVGSPATATLPFKVGDDQSSHVAVSVVIMDGRGEILRTLPAGTINVTPGGPPTAGSVTWDGKDSSGKTLALGLVTYRVVATDQAGNIAESAESNPIQLLLPAINLPAFLIHVLIDIG